MNLKLHLRKSAEILLFLATGLSTAAYANTQSVSFKSHHNKYFVNEGDGGDRTTVNANRSKIGAWERMTIDNSASACIKHGNKVSLKSGNNRYWSAQPNGALDVNRTKVYSWEKFTLINHSNQSECIKNNDLISLRSAHNRYVVAEKNGQANANRRAIGSWERFRVVVHDEQKQEEETITQTCNFMSISTCMLPFPSDQYTKVNASNTTGIEVDLKGSLFEPKLEAMFQEEGFGSKYVYENKDGFSAAASVTFELPSSIKESTLPEDGGNAFMMFNMNTGERVNIRASVNTLSLDYKDPITAVQAYPRSRFDFGSQFIAVITKSLKSKSGDNYSSVDAVTQLKNNRGDIKNQALSQTHGAALDFLAAKGIPASEIISFTKFTTISEDGNNNEFLKLVDIINTHDNPVEIKNVWPIPFGPVAAIVIGKIKLRNFQDEYGRVRYSPGNIGKGLETDIVLHIPRKAIKGERSPVAVYGHALSAFKETGLIHALPNAAYGIATVYIDQPYHGKRVKDFGDLKSQFKPERMRHVSGLVSQSSLDLHSVVRALKTSLSSLNVVPKNNWWNRTFNKKGLRTPDLDTSRIYYQATSLGGVLGSTFLSTSNAVKDGYLEVTGVGISQILLNSLVFKMLGFDGMIPEDISGGDAALITHAVQTEIDSADAINFVHYLRHGKLGRLDPKPVTVQHGIKDGIVFNPSSHAFAELAELPLIGRVHKNIPYLDRTKNYEDSDGYALIQSPFVSDLPLGGAIKLIPFLDQIVNGIMGEPLSGLADGGPPHGSFIGPKAQYWLHKWRKRNN